MRQQQNVANWLRYGRGGVIGGKGIPIRIGIQCEVGTGQAGVGYMALGGIMLAFGINVSQFREHLLCFPLLPLVVVVWRICTNVIWKSSSVFFYFPTATASKAHQSFTLAARERESLKCIANVTGADTSSLCATCHMPSDYWTSVCPGISGCLPAGFGLLLFVQFMRGSFLRIRNSRGLRKIDYALGANTFSSATHTHTQTYLLNIMCRCCCCLSTLQLPLTRRAKSQPACCRERSASCLSSLCVSALPTYSRWHIHLFFGMRGELRTCWWFQTLQSAAGNFGILTDSRTLPAPGLSPLLIYLPDNLPLCVYLCVPVCCCQKLHFVY